MQRLVNQCNQFPFQGADDGRRLTERGASAVDLLLIEQPRPTHLRIRSQQRRDMLPLGGTHHA